jgi:hypothetical protein
MLIFVHNTTTGQDKKTYNLAIKKYSHDLSMCSGQTNHILEPYHDCHDATNGGITCTEQFWALADVGGHCPFLRSPNKMRAMPSRSATERAILFDGLEAGIRTYTLGKGERPRSQRPMANEEKNRKTH